MDFYEQLADEINHDISTILRNALSGYDQSYWLNGSFIRWGLVEKDIRSVVSSKLSFEGIEGNPNISDKVYF